MLGDGLLCAVIPNELCKEIKCKFKIKEIAMKAMKMYGYLVEPRDVWEWYVHDWNIYDSCIASHYWIRTKR